MKNLDFVCTFDQCCYSPFCSLFNSQEDQSVYLAMRPPVTDEFKCVIFQPTTSVANKIFKASKTPKPIDAEVI